MASSKVPLRIPEKYAELRPIFNTLQRELLAANEQLAELAKSTADTAQTTADTAQTTAEAAQTAVDNLDGGFTGEFKEFEFLLEEY